MATVETYKEGERVVTIVERNSKYSFKIWPGHCAYCLGVWYESIDKAKDGVTAYFSNRGKFIAKTPAFNRKPKTATQIAGRVKFKGKVYSIRSHEKDKNNG
jgi:hypothetical protein